MGVRRVQALLLVLVAASLAGGVGRVVEGRDAGGAGEPQASSAVGVDAQPPLSRSLGLAAIGDSITVYDDDPEEGILNNSWFAQVVRADPTFAYVFNAGESGDSTSQMLARLDEDVLRHRPDVVLVLGGVNDIANNVRAETIVDNLRTMLDEVHAAEAHPMIGTITPWDEDWAREPVRELNTLIRSLADELAVPLIDFYAVTADSDGAWLPGMSKDGLHPTLEGSAVMAQAALEVLRPRSAGHALLVEDRRDPGARLADGRTLPDVRGQREQRQP